MNFQYFTTKVVNAELDIDNIGECAIKAYNDIGEEFILIIETSMGVTRILEYGPAKIDFELAPDSVNLHFSRMNFNEKVISKTIQSFLNNPYHKVTQAFECDKQEALADCKDMISYMNQSDFW